MKTYHVKWLNGQWAVREAGGTDPLMSTDSMLAAIDFAKAAVRKEAGIVLIFDQSGRQAGRINFSKQSY